LFTILVVGVATFSLSAQEPKAVDMKALALSDLKQGKLKYYAFGFAGPSKELVEKAKKLGITVVPKGCVLDEGLVRYNEVADSLFKHGLKKEEIRPYKIP
jgi:hypothetical protein